MNDKLSLAERCGVPIRLLRGVVVPHKDGLVWLRVVEDPANCDNFSIVAVPSREDRREFRFEVKGNQMAQEKNPTSAIVGSCRIACDQANWMPPVWCAEWCLRDSLEYGCKA